MIARGDIYEIRHIAENVEELYNFITNELGIEESKQQKLVDEITHQFINADNSIDMLEAENEDLEERNAYLEDDVERLEYDNSDLEDEVYWLEEENDRLESENEELRNKLNEWKNGRN